MKELFKDEFDNVKNRMHLQENIHLLEKERVVIALHQ
jgi:hypothetical protein